LVIDLTIYPRHEISSQHVSDLVRAIAAGESLPPVIVEETSWRIVDGVHRYHAYQRAEVTQVAVEAHTYADEAELYLDAASRNATHGRPLDRRDQVRVVDRASELHADASRIAGALHTTVARVEQLRLRVAFDANGRTVVLKGTTAHLQGETLTAAQLMANERAGGNRPLFYIEQTINLLQGGLLDTQNEHVQERMRVLVELLNRALGVMV
jgi:ParB-like chromosome segregation protein Spo0J